MAYYVSILNNTDGNTYKLKVPIFENDSDAETFLKGYGDVLKENCNNEYKYQPAARTWSGDILNAQLNALPAEILGVGGVYMAGDTTKDLYLGCKTSYFDTLPVGVYSVGNGTMTIVNNITQSVLPFSGTMWGGDTYSFTGRGIVYEPNTNYNYLTGVSTDFGFSRYGVTSGASRAYYSVNLCMAYYNSTTDRIVLVDYAKWGDSDKWRYTRQFEYTGIELKETQIDITPDNSDAEIDTETGEGTEDAEEQIGGEGTFDFNDINININNDRYTPTTGLLGSGIATLKKISYANLRQLGEFLYSDSMLDALSHFFAGDVEKAIIDLYQLPVALSTETEPSNIKFGSADSGISGYTVTSPIFDINFGTVDVTKINTNSFLDFSPYVKFYLFLPFIGTREIETNLIRSVNDKDTTLGLNYRIDALTGDCVAQLTISKRNNYVLNDANGKLDIKNTKTDFVIKEFTGNCKKSLPRGASNTMNDILSGMSNILNGSRNLGDMSQLVNGITSVANGIQNITGNHISSTGVSSNLGYLSLRTPYLMCMSPVVYSRGNRFGQLNGYASEKFVKLNDNKGFIKAKNIIASGFGGTAHEQERVIELLQNGVWCK